ncbi:MAG: insulinase family protein, partial [Treponema sp.]|nr:insulinase family protein [Treponema sp.]
MRLRRFFACLCFLCVCSLWSESTGIAGLFRYKLENGLELYVVENDSAPLVTIEIAVRTGAFAQTPENAGLFHLYEHMMFKGNSRYANESETTEAMNTLGVGEWNGTTGIDRVNYYFTIPSSLLRQGLEFWSYAVRTPLMDEKELENEKKVVLSEIRGNFTTPSRIANAALSRTLYPQMPYKLDPSGRAENVENCTVETLKKIQAEYYVPDNSAVFVGGDVDHEQVFELVKEIYGDWKPSASGIKSPSSHSKAPLKNTKKLVYPDPRVASVMTYASLYLRGPDGEWDRTDTYAADVWNTLINNPSGAYASALLSESELNIKDSDYTGGYY